MQILQLLDTLKQLPYYTKQNLPLALNKEGEDLNYWIKKLTKEKQLLPLKKGFYISAGYQDRLIRDPQQSEIYWVYLANILRSPSYVSLEYALAKYNLIPESVFAITCVTIKSSRKYVSKTATFTYRNLKKSLYYGYRLLAFGNTGLTAKIAYPYKALFDYLYLNKSISVSSRQFSKYLLEESRINWDVLTKKDKLSFTKAVQDSGSKKMLKICSILTKEGIIC
jgi:hypothetical protein